MDTYLIRMTTSERHADIARFAGAHQAVRAAKLARRADTDGTPPAASLAGRVWKRASHSLRHPVAARPVALA